MNAWWFILIAAGAVMLTVSVAAARQPCIGRREVRAFQAVNGLPDGLYPVLWLPMQLGNLVVGMLVGGIVAVVQRELIIAIGVVLATLLKVVTERVVRRRMAGYLAVRQRPGTSQPKARLRGDVPASGPSFPSGHVILVAAIGGVVAPHLAVAWWTLLLFVTALVMLGRVYVGAHNPLDVTAGAGAGLILGGLLAAFSS
jgi:membrane-associated phospholipid phosphatase